MCFAKRLDALSACSVVEARNCSFKQLHVPTVEWLRKAFSYLDAWFSPSRFSRSRKRLCSGVGVLGLKATRYHSG